MGRHPEMPCKSLTLPLPSLLVPTPFTKWGSDRPPSYFKNRCLHENEIL